MGKRIWTNSKNRKKGGEGQALPALMSTWPAPAAPSVFHAGRAEGGVRERSPLALDFLHGLVLPQAGCVVPAGALEHGGRGEPDREWRTGALVAGGTGSSCLVGCRPASTQVQQEEEAGRLPRGTHRPAGEQTGPPTLHF